MPEPRTRDRPRVAVVGGGISGLTAAIELARAGVEVELLEHDDRLGGRISRAELAGVPIDIGAESFATRGEGVERLLADLGLSERIVRPAPLGSWVVDDVRAAPLPASGALGIPAAPLSRAARRSLGLGGALRAAIEPMLPRRVGETAGSVAELVAERLGRRVLDRVVRPVALGVYSTAPERLAVSDVPGLADALTRHGSLLAATAELRASRTAAGGAAAGLRGGMAALVDALAEILETHGARLRTRATVRELEECPEGWRLAGPWGETLADAVILAVPARVATHLLQPLVQPSRDATDERPVAPADTEPAGTVEVVALALDDPRLDVAPRGTGALVGSEGAAAPSRTIHAKALTHVTAKWPLLARRLPSGRHILRLSYGRVGEPPMTAGLDDDEVRGIALADASLILGIGPHADSLRGIVRRTWPIERALPAPSRLPRGLALAGDGVDGVGLASVVPGARRAAAHLLRTLAEGSPNGAASPRATARISEAEGAGAR